MKAWHHSWWPRCSGRAAKAVKREPLPVPPEGAMKVLWMEPVCSRVGLLCVKGHVMKADVARSVSTVAMTSEGVVWLQVWLFSKFEEPSDEKCQQMVQLQSNFFLAHPGLSPPETPAQQRWCVLLLWSRQTTTSRSIHPRHPPGFYDPSKLHFITLPNEWTHFRVIVLAPQAILQAVRQCSKEQGERG